MDTGNFNCGQLILILSILWLPNLVAGRGDDYSTAQVPTSWMNNEISTLNIATDGNMRLILLKELPDEDWGFAFAFTDYPIDSLAVVCARKESYGWSTSDDMVWVASTENVHRNATLTLLADGNLVLRDSDGALKWSTNTANRSVVGIKLMENGNLVLHDRDNVTVWQSIDYPKGTTLLDGQKLRAGEKLVNENYSLLVTSQGLFAFYNSQMYFKFLVQGTSYFMSTNGTFGLYTSLNEADGMFPIPSSSTLLFMRLDSDGHFRAYTKEGNVDILDYFLTACDYPMACGNYGLCSSSGSCSCPSGYARVSGECKEEYPTTCDGSGSTQLEPYSNVYHFSYVNSELHAVIKGADLESCRQFCLRNCSCKVILFRYILNDSHGNCYMPSPVLTLINDGINRNNYQSSVFIKITNRISSTVGSSKPSNRNKKKTQIIALSSVGVFIIIVMVPIGSWMACFRVRKRGVEKDSNEDFEEIPGMPSRFSYQELKIATSDFETKLGEGGFGSVFEGQLHNGDMVAVKRLDGLSQGRKEFMAEVQTIGSIYHMNLVKLIGFCAEKSNRLLVYEYMCNRSLDKWIFRGKVPVEQPPMNWESRKNIILDIAKGLTYLHEECIQKIVHLDIKPQNILLDSNFRAKVSDFGLSKFIDRDQSQIVTTMRGTPGYLAPEWLTSSITEKADVYSYGIVVMEVVCGRRNLDRSQPEEFMHLLSLFKEKAEADKLIDLVDNYGAQKMEYEQVLEAVKMMRLAAWCLQADYNRRPSMSVVVKVIEGAMEIDPNLDYSFPNPTVKVGIDQMKTTVTLLPSTLSAPR